MAATATVPGDELVICRRTHRLHRPGEAFDPWQLCWGRAEDPEDGESVTPLQAVSRLAGGGRLRRVPVAIIGPKEASDSQRETARTLARRLTERGFTLICGGRSGVMEAASRGCHEGGGMMIGILPGEEWREANDHVAIPIATGLGVARNAIIARAAFALVAVGGGHGTITEMAFGLHFDRLVLALEEAPSVPGARVCAGIDEVETHLARRILALDATDRQDAGDSWRR